MVDQNPLDDHECDGPLDHIISEYLSDHEFGDQEQERIALLARYPAFARELTEFFQNWDLVDRKQDTASVQSEQTPRNSQIICAHCQEGFDSSLVSKQCPACGNDVPVENIEQVELPAVQIGRFHIRGTAGQGAFGTVYKAWDPELHRIVALKVPRQGHRMSPDDLERFHREARLTLKLHHDYIVRIFEVCKLGNVPFLVCEFVPGRTLADFIEDEKPQPRMAASITAAIARGLGHAHAQGVIHRDVKPSNILLTQDMTPKLTDFGLARHDTEKSLTETGEPIGTAAYMSPEQSLGQRQIDGRSDIYSLGAVLYQMLTGHQPFDGNFNMVLEQIRKVDPRPPRMFNDRIPVDLETICLKCLRKEPRLRYLTAEELADDLQRFLDDQPILARPMTIGQNFMQWLRRNPGLFALSALTAASLVAISLTSTLWALHSQKLTEIAEESAARANEATSENLFDRGLTECESGDIGAGLHSLRKALDFVPKTSPHLEWCIRTNLNAWLKEHPPLTESHEPPAGEILAIARDGQKIWMNQSKSASSTIQCWNRLIGQFDQPIWKTDFLVRKVLLSPNGDRLAVVTAKTPFDSRIQCLSTATLAPSTKAVGIAHLLDIAFTPDGALITATKMVNEKGIPNKKQTKLEWWNTNLMESSGRTLELADHLDAMLVSNDNRTLISLVQSGSILRMSDLSGLKVREIKLKKPILEPKLALSNDDRWLLAGGKDRMAKLIDLRTESPVCHFRHRMPVACVTFSSDGKRAITGANSDALRFWEGIESLGEPSHKEKIGRSPSIASTSNGLRLASAMHNGHIRIWDLVGGKLNLAREFPRDRGNQRLVRFNLDDSRIASSTYTANGVTLWDAETGTPLTYLDHPSHVRDIAFDPSGKYIATTGLDRDVWVWKFDGNRHLEPLRHQAEVRKTVFTPDGKTLITVSEDGSICYWDVRTGRLSRGPFQHGGNSPIRDIALQPNGRNFATIADDGDAHQWLLEDGSYLGSSFFHGFQPRIIKYNSDGHFLLTGGNDHIVRTWHASTGKTQGRQMQHLANVTSAKFSPCDQWIVSTSEDGTARYWASDSGRPIGPSLMHDGQVKDVFPGADHSVTVGMDSTIRVWNCPKILSGDPSSISRKINYITGSHQTIDGQVGSLAPNEWNALK